VHVLLTTDRLTLRRFTADDVDDLVCLDSDPVVMRYLTGGRPTPRELFTREVLPKIFRWYATGTLGRWAAEDRLTGGFLGWFALDATDQAGEGELGYRLRAAAWGRGLAAEGSRALIDKGFTEWGLRRIWAQTMAVNTASRRVMEKSGLTYLRTFYPGFNDPIPGAEHGEVEYQLLRTDWANRRAT
jgi:RimJ/RimL family protein N-acetyltransferase